MDLLNDLHVDNCKKIEKVVDLELVLDKKLKEIEDQNINALKRIDNFEEESGSHDSRSTGISYLPLSIQRDPESLKRILNVVTRKCEAHSVRILFERRDKRILKKKYQDLGKSNVKYF